MKLRIRGDSLRFRLTQREVARLAAGDKIGESVHFSATTEEEMLKYSIEACKDIAQVSAGFKNGEILVSLPAEMVESWANTDQVGIESTQSTGEGRELRIVIEKDFQCLQSRPEEDESDNFPHPQQATTS